MVSVFQMDVRRHDPDLNPETPGKEAKQVHLHKSPGRVHCGGGRQWVANLHHEAVNCRSFIKGTVPSKLSVNPFRTNTPKYLIFRGKKFSLFHQRIGNTNFFIFITYQ